MAISTLGYPNPILGNIEFIDFAEPETLRFTPTQNVVIHKFIGGMRQMDVMGQDNDVIKWSGLFLGPDASANAEAINQMIDDGQKQGLVWGGFSADVVVKQCAFDYHSPFLIDYSIECYVLQDAEVDAVAFNGAAAINAAGNVANGQAPQ